MPTGKAPPLALVVANRPRITMGLGHVPTDWKPCLVSLFGSANRLRAMPLGFRIVGGLGLLCIRGQAGLGLNGPWAYGVASLKTLVLRMILSSKP